MKAGRLLAWLSLGLGAALAIPLAAWPQAAAQIGVNDIHAARTTVTTQCPASSGGFCANPVTLQWNLPFPDANYNAACTVEASTTDSALWMSSLTPTTITVSVSVPAGQPATYHCLGVEAASGVPNGSAEVSATGFAQAPGTVTWSPPFTDTYTAACAPELVSGAVEKPFSVSSLTSNSITAELGVDGTVIYHCLGVPDTSSFRHGRLSDSCPAGSFCTADVQVPWSQAFPNTNYTAACTVEVDSGEIDGQYMITSVSTADIGMQVVLVGMSGTTAVPGQVVFHCIGVPDAIATVTAASGNVTILSPSAAQTTAAVGSSLGEGDELVTGANSSATIQFQDGSQVQVGAGTTFLLDLVFQQAADYIDQLIGSLEHTVVTCLVTGLECYQVKTPTAVAGVRGTKFSTQVSYAENLVSTTVSVQDGTVEVTDLSTGSTNSVSAGSQTTITGTAAVTVEPTSLTFPSQTVGTPSTAQAVTLANSSTAALSVTGISVSGTNAGDFAQSNDCGTSVAAASSCTISVAFTPSAAGTRTAALFISDSFFSSPQTVALSGTGAVPPDFALSATPASATVSPGQSATYTLSVTPQNGFSQSVALSCTGAPAVATCSINPASVTPSGSSAASATVTVTTAALGSALPGSAVRRAPPGAPWAGAHSLWDLLVGLCLGALLLVGIRWRRPRARHAHVLSALALAATLLGVLAWAACESGTIRLPPGTPAGTYTLKLTGSSGSQTHSTGVTLIVK